jgi:hypothetical protein
MEKLLEVGDSFNGLIVTKINNNFCFFDKKRISWGNIEKLILKGEKVVKQYSSNIPVDWTSKENVSEYYNSFKIWSTYISGYSSRYIVYEFITDVKDGMVFFNNEYYLPSPTAKYINDAYFWNAKNHIEDGRYNVRLYKQKNDWHPNLKINDDSVITLNIFNVGAKLKTNIKDLKNTNSDIYCYSTYSSNNGLTFESSHSVRYGVDISFSSFDEEKFFKYYYLTSFKETIMELSHMEIVTIMNPIKNKIENIIKKAFECEDYYIDISSEWGEVYISNHLRLKQHVSDEIFSIIDKRIQTFSK